MRLGNRTYRVWVKLELPKYFFNLHTDCATVYQIYQSAGLFSFKNFQLMSITDSLYRPSSFACALPLFVNLTLNLKVAGTLRGECLNGIHTVDLVPSA